MRLRRSARDFIAGSHNLSVETDTTWHVARAGCFAVGRIHCPKKVQIAKSLAVAVKTGDFSDGLQQYFHMQCASFSEEGGPSDLNIPWYLRRSMSIMSLNVA
jgi:hypothetical protein